MHHITSNKITIPQLGFGVFRMSDAEIDTIIPTALETGFRHFDTAQIYGNEAALGHRLHAAGIPRSELFLTTKVWVENYSAAKFGASIQESLERLQTDYVDLLLLHWPGQELPIEAQIDLLNEAHGAGQARAIGVSNQNLNQLRTSINRSAAPIFTNQIEVHPYLDQSLMLAEAAQLGTTITGYFGMADGAVPHDELLQRIGEKYGKSAAQVALRWQIQQGIVTLSKTANALRVPENYDIFDFVLSAHDMAEISSLSRPNGRLVSPSGLASNWAE